MFNNTSALVENVLYHTVTMDIKNPNNEQVVHLEDSERTALVAVITLMTVIIALGSFGNILVTMAIIQNRKLRTVSNLFVANLSICDLMFVSVVLPVNMYTYLTDGWHYQEEICKFIGFLGYTLTGTTIMTITLIAWNRYKLVVDVSKYKHLFRKSNMAVMMACTWIVPVVCLQPAVSGAWGHFGYIPMLSSCNLGLDNSSQTFKIFLLIVRAAIPCGLIIYYYTAIYVTTRASHQRLRFLSSTTTNSTMRLNNQRREMRLTRMMIAIFLVFVLSYFPCTISSVIDWSRMLSKTFHMFCQTSVFLGSAINPLLYGFMNEQFRTAYYQILTCRVMCRSTKGRHTYDEETENHNAALGHRENTLDNGCPEESDWALRRDWDNLSENAESRQYETCDSNTSTKGSTSTTDCQVSLDDTSGIQKLLSCKSEIP
ncbi:cytochrome P450 2U1 [Biomphalaria pfeifferi]|uniref:Cytochrome P450 2U1 n=1 Tax=Biomphalaria pfeifferi TaxID=112525 RepID=A0AAD8AYF6_BIOPF|nr:cytochrome P450 2U1 [Biomphalaria pfeifferi]